MLPHLDYKRMSSKKAEDFVNGENMDVIAPVASKCDKEVYDKEKCAVKEKLLSILKNKYDIDEEDFYSSEFELVPEGKA